VALSSAWVELHCTCVGSQMVACAVRACVAGDDDAVVKHSSCRVVGGTHACMCHTLWGILLVPMPLSRCAGQSGWSSCKGWLDVSHAGSMSAVAYNARSWPWAHQMPGYVACVAAVNNSLMACERGGWCTDMW
jgi:hypothetical protein